MTQLQKIQWNVSKIIVESIFIKEYDVVLTDDDKKTLKFIESILGKDVFEKLCCKIMEEN
jgi:hypothetical protein